MLLRDTITGREETQQPNRDTKRPQRHTTELQNAAAHYSRCKLRKCTTGSCYYFSLSMLVVRHGLQLSVFVHKDNISSSNIQREQIKTQKYYHNDTQKNTQDDHKIHKMTTEMIRKLTLRVKSTEQHNSHGREELVHLEFVILKFLFKVSC